MAIAIRNLIKNPELATTYGIQARNVVENELIWDRERQNLLALFEFRQSQTMSLKGRNDN
jgi:glycosyltransferase involved in cell wall biosynthesis